MTKVKFWSYFWVEFALYIVIGRTTKNSVQRLERLKEGLGRG